MTNPNTDKIFSGSVPKLYETYLVPLIFEPYAADLAKRLEAKRVSRVLEIAGVTDDPPRFLARTPHGYHDRSRIGRDLAAGGFTAAPRIDTVAARSRAKSPREPAMAYCQGTPLRNEIETRDPARLGQATDVAAEAIAARFGRGAVDGKIQAHIVTVGALAG